MSAEARIAALETRIARLEARLSEPLPTAALPPLRRVVETVARDFGITVEEMLSAAQTANLVEARGAAALLMRRVHSASYVRIGRALNRDHSTCIHAATGAAIRMSRDAAYAARITTLTERLKEHAA